MNPFAGFWVDGAVRLPKYKDSDCGLFFVKSKGGLDELLDITCVEGVDVTADHYWLDTSPRESLTPEELFSLLKVIWPKTQVVNNPEGGAVVGWQVPHEATDNATPIEWGGLTQYPPDLDWVRVTKDNVSQHLFKDCRHRDREGVWRTGQIIGWSLDTDRCIVHNGYPDFCTCVEVRLQGSE